MSKYVVEMNGNSYKVIDTISGVVIDSDIGTAEWANGVCKFFNDNPPKFNIGDKVKLPNHHGDTILTINGIEPGPSKCSYHFAELDEDDEDGWYPESNLVAA